MMAADAGSMIVPEGFTIQASESLENYWIVRGWQGCATVDLKQRNFRLGIAYRGKFVSAVRDGKFVSVGKYTGRGWQQRLVDDAVAALKGIGA